MSDRKTRKATHKKTKNKRGEEVTIDAALHRLRKLENVSGERARATERRGGRTRLPLGPGSSIEQLAGSGAARDGLRTARRWRDMRSSAGGESEEEAVREREREGTPLRRSLGKRLFPGGCAAREMDALCHLF